MQNGQDRAVSLCWVLQAPQNTAAMFSRLAGAVEWNSDGMFGNRANEGAKEAAANKNKKSWFGTSNAGASSTPEAVPDAIRTQEGGEQEDNEAEEELEVMQGDDYDEDDIDKPLPVLESYYEKTAKEKNLEKSKADREDTDSDEEEEQKQFNETMAETLRIFKNSVEDEQRTKGRDKRDGPVNDNHNKYLSTLTSVQTALENGEKKQQATGFEHSSKEKGGQKAQAPDAAGKKKAPRKVQHHAEEDFEITEKCVIDDRYKQKVQALLEKKKEAEDYAENDPSSEGHQNKLKDYREAMSSRFVKLSGDDDRDMVPGFDNHTEAVKHCVKKYNEECQRLGLFKAFSIDDQTSTDGLDARQRTNLQANIDRLSDDAFLNEDTHKKGDANKRGGEASAKNRIAAQSSGVMEWIK